MNDSQLARVENLCKTLEIEVMLLQQRIEACYGVGEHVELERGLLMVSLVQRKKRLNSLLMLCFREQPMAEESDGGP